MQVESRKFLQKQPHFQKTSSHQDEKQEPDKEIDELYSTRQVGKVVLATASVWKSSCFQTRQYLSSMDRGVVRFLSLAAAVLYIFRLKVHGLESSSLETLVIFLFHFSTKSLSFLDLS